MYLGNVVGFRFFDVVSKSTGKPVRGYELCVRRLDTSRNPDFVGEQFDTFAAFANAVGEYKPAPGDGIQYHLYWQNGRQNCGYILPRPDLNE